MIRCAAILCLLVVSICSADPIPEISLPCCEPLTGFSGRKILIDDQVFDDLKVYEADLLPYDKATDLTLVKSVKYAPEEGLYLKAIGKNSFFYIKTAESGFRAECFDVVEKDPEIYFSSVIGTKYKSQKIPYNLLTEVVEITNTEETLAVVFVYTDGVVARIFIKNLYFG